MSLRMQKWISRLLTFVMVGAAFLPAYALKEEPKPDIDSFPEQHVLLCIAGQEQAFLGLEKDADARAYPASIVKLLTALVALERAEETTVVVVKEEATKLSAANSKIGIRECEQYTMLDLLYGLLLPSGCDAAKAIAMYFSGDEESFAELMNEKARSLGMTNSHFTNASGLHDERQYTTARDLAKLGAAVAEQQRLCEILQVGEHTIEELTTGRKIKVKNINRLVAEPTPGDYEKLSALYPYCIGGKTGSTNAAGRTFMAMARYGDVTLVCVLLEDKASTSSLSGGKKDRVIANRFKEARELFAYGYSMLFPDTDIASLLKQYGLDSFPHEVEGAALLLSPSCPETPIELPKEALAQADAWEARPSFLEASLPLAAGQLLGEVSYYSGESLLFTLPIHCPCEVKGAENTPAPRIGIGGEVLPIGEEMASQPQEDEEQGDRGRYLLYLLPLMALLLSAAFVLWCLKIRMAGKRKRK